MKRTRIKRKAGLKRTAFKKKKKKELKTSVVRRLQKKAEELWKQYAYLRDGRCCKVKQFFPQIQIAHTETFQVDHTFTRGDKNLFLDPHNSLVVCSACNRAKFWNNKSIHRAIDDIVEARDSREFYRMRCVSHYNPPNYNWTNPIWLEEQIERLNKLIKGDIE